MGSMNKSLKAKAIRVMQNPKDPSPLDRKAHDCIGDIKTLVQTIALIDIDIVELVWFLG